jgi:GDPmannose 4,6-dehydratase|tara:strand:- start:186 stop:1181 length:996 start_codon:yes stop_codon:yes gene_type:complete
MKRKALITGITGQDGSYLAELLLSKDYEVHGLVRRSSHGYGNLRNIIHLIQDDKIYRKSLHLHAGDLADPSSINRIIGDIRPQEIYNLAAQADVQESFLMPEYSVDVNGNGVIRILEAVKNIDPTIKVYQASTSELFGNSEETPQNEGTRFNPQSPYSIGKFVGFQAIKKYREMYGLFCCNGILFNHESERRGDDYLTRKVTKAVARIKLGLQKELRLGNLDAKRDWGYSPDYVEAMWLMMQKGEASDYVIATGETHTVEEWVKAAFELAGLNWKEHVVIDKKFFRPAEVHVLCGDYSKSEKILGWKPKVKFKELVGKMLAHDLREQGKSN